MRLEKDQVLQIFYYFSKGVTVVQIARHYSVTPETIVYHLKKKRGVLEVEQFCSFCHGPLEKPRVMRTRHPFSCLKCQRSRNKERTRARYHKLHENH